MARSVEKIKAKYGKDAFKRWGSPSSGGGNPLLIAQGQGYKITVHKELRSKSAPHTIIRRKGKRRATQV